MYKRNYRQRNIGNSRYFTCETENNRKSDLKNKNNQFAVMYSKKFDFYSFPGGGVKENEDIQTALIREIKEETGCTCDVIEELGYVMENRAYCDYTQISYYFLVTTYDFELHPEFTASEKENKTTVTWNTLDETIRRITNPIYETVQRRFLQARDIAALNAYLSSIAVYE